MGRGIFRPFTSGTDAKSRQARLKRARELHAAKRRVAALKVKIASGGTLTHEDHQVLAKCGPKTLAYIGYQRTVTLT